MKIKGIILVSVIAIILVLAIYFSGFLQPEYKITINPIDPQDLGPEEWMEDFEYLYDYMEGNYPYLMVKNRTHGYNWLDLREQFEERIRGVKNNEEFLEIISSIVIALQNRHTFVMDPDRVIENHNQMTDPPGSEVFAKEVADAAGYWSNIYNHYDDGRFGWKYDVLVVYDGGEYVVYDSDDAWEQSYGENAVVTHVNGIPIDDAIGTLYDREYIDFDFKREKNYVWSIYPRHFGNDATFTVRSSSGQTDDVTLDVESGSSIHPYRYPQTPVNLTKYPDNGIAYMYVSKFYGSDVEDRLEDVLDFYKQIEDYDHLIIDIRGNTGGFYSFWTDGIVQHLIEEKTVLEYYNAYRTGKYLNHLHSKYLIKKISKDQVDYLPPEVQTDDFRIYKFWQTIDPTDLVEFKGSISILIDNMVYSAAEGFLHFAGKYDFAKIYGTPSGGDGLMVWPLFIVLPNSKLVINSASALGLDNNGYANEEVRTQPDVFFESSYGNWDELIEFVIDDLTH